MFNSVEFLSNFAVEKSSYVIKPRYHYSTSRPGSENDIVSYCRVYMYKAVDENKREAVSCVALCEYCGRVRRERREAHETRERNSDVWRCDVVVWT